MVGTRREDACGKGRKTQEADEFEGALDLDGWMM